MVILITCTLRMETVTEVYETIILSISLTEALMCN